MFLVSLSAEHPWGFDCRFKTLMRFYRQILLVILATGLVLAVASPSDNATGNGAAASAVTGLLAAVGLSGLPMLWLVVAYLAVRCNNQSLELVATITMSVLLAWPVRQH